MAVYRFQYTVQRVIGRRQDFLAGFDSYNDALNFAEAKWNAEDRAASFYVWLEHDGDLGTLLHAFRAEQVAA